MAPIVKSAGSTLSGLIVFERSEDISVLSVLSLLDVVSVRLAIL